MIDIVKKIFGEGFEMVIFIKAIKNKIV